VGAGGGKGSGTPLYYYQDLQGNTRALEDSTGTVVNVQNYSPYGVATGSFGNTSWTPLQYDGTYTDGTTGFVYDQARWYDPSTGQFLSQDPLVDQTLQPYAYAADSPVNASDPTGLSSVGFCGDIGALVPIGFLPVVAVGVNAEVCPLVRISGGRHNGQIGGTAIGAVGLGAGVIGKAGLSVQVSNASKLSDLGGLFFFVTVARALGGFGAKATVFWNGSTSRPIVGADIGWQSGLGAGGYAGASWTLANTYGGWWGWLADAARGAFDAVSAIDGPSRSRTEKWGQGALRFYRLHRKEFKRMKATCRHHRKKCHR